MIKCYGFLVLSWSWAFACGCFFLYGRPCRIPCVLSFFASCWLWLRSSLFSSGTIYDSWKRKGIPLKISGIPFLDIWCAPNLIFCCVGKGSNKRGIVGPFPKQQNGGFAALAHAPNLLPSNEQLIYLLLYSAQADCQATCAIAVSLTGEIFRVPGGQPKSHRDSGMGVFRDMEKRMFTSSENAKAFPAENSN